MVKTKVWGYVIEHQYNVKQENETCVWEKKNKIGNKKKLGLEEVEGDRARKTDSWKTTCLVMYNLIVFGSKHNIPCDCCYSHERCTA